MEFYLVGGVFGLLGFLIRLVVSRWAKTPSTRRREGRWFMGLVILVVSLWVFSPLVFPLVADILVGLGLPVEESIYAGWYGCLVFYALLGLGMGWLLGYDKTPRANWGNPYADNSPHQPEW